ncbi:hypothetical protein [Dyella humicola]|uniref:hypothetical protein n=1 Tax=Dyella humicola TaxID=2992126 RepID=UPI00225377A7|nr:hypothetical protein [Dyella humicola]
MARAADRNAGQSPALFLKPQRSTKVDKSGSTFEDIANDIASVVMWREELVSSAIDILEYRHPKLALALIENVGNRKRAGHWICTHQRVNGGKSPCELLADGDEDSVWDLLDSIWRVDGSPDKARTNLTY